MTKQKSIGGDIPTNDAKRLIEQIFPYRVSVKIQGVSDFLFHRWNCESVDERAQAKKGSKIKKTDDLDSYVYRNEKNQLCIPGEYLRMSIINAAKFQQDPRSSRKSAMDLFKAGVISLSSLCPLGTEKWDYEDKRKVNIQRNGINRIRPAMRAGWEAVFEFMINLPEYITPSYFNEVIQSAGRLVGVGDFRPTYGRFQVTNFSVPA